MLIKERLVKVIDKLNKQDTKQMLVSDPKAIYYLLEKHFYPGERFLALYISFFKEPVLFLNELFRIEEDLGIEVIYINDNTNLIEVLEKVIDKEETLAVDKSLVARYLLPLIDHQLAKAFINGSYAIDEARACKDAEEKRRMRLSSHINDLAMAEFKKLPKDGITEKEIADQMLSIYESLGASGYSFEPIVAFGKNAADPHHMPDNTILKEGNLILFDVGCVVEDYCSDMTRVFCYKKEPNEAQTKIYNLVREANEKAIATCKAGVKLSDIDKAARDVISEAGYGKDFTHRLGHFIGIEDHDFGDVSSANDKLTEVGNIFSIEPGIYSLEEGIGVRIEDLVLITEDGVEVLNSYTHDLEVIY